MGENRTGRELSMVVGMELQVCFYSAENMPGLLTCVAM
jgi:hypothetical protein